MPAVRDLPRHLKKDEEDFFANLDEPVQTPFAHAAAAEVVNKSTRALGETNFPRNNHESLWLSAHSELTSTNQLRKICLEANKVPTIPEGDHEEFSFHFEKTLRPSPTLSRHVLYCDAARSVRPDGSSTRRRAGVSCKGPQAATRAVAPLSAESSPDEEVEDHCFFTAAPLLVLFSLVGVLGILLGLEGCRFLDGPQGRITFNKRNSIENVHQTSVVWAMA